MKLSNNAIKFLMAQYRAIYKNAYVKGLATAVILTSALAAGQAQAKNIANLEALAGSTPQVIDEKTAAALKGTGNKDWNTSLTVQSGSGHSISAETSGELVLSGSSGSLVINESGKTPDLSIKAGATDQDAPLANIKVDINSITVSEGKLSIAGGSGDGGLSTATVTAGEIIIGSTGTSEVTIGDGKEAGAATLGSSTSVTKLGKGKIIFNGSGAGLAVLTGELQGTGTDIGTIQFSGAAGDLNAWGKDVNVNITVDAVQDIAASINLIDDEKTSDVNEGLLGIKSGTLTITGDGTNAAKLVLAQGTLDLGKDVVITQPSASGGTMEIGSGTKSAELRLTKDQLSKLITAADPANNGRVDFTGTGVNKIVIKPAADEKVIDLGGLKFGTASASGTISAANTANAFITTEGEMAFKSAVTGDSTNITFKADTITLGDATAAALGVKKSEAAKFNFLKADGKTQATDYELKDVAGYIKTAEAVNTYKEGDKKVLVADKGDDITTNLKITNAGELKVLGGDYTATGKIELDKGNITVGGAAKGVDASLTLTGAIVLNNNQTNNNTISVTGGDKSQMGPSTQANLSGNAVTRVTLDLTKSNLQLKTKAQQKGLTTIKAEGDGATLLMTASQVATVLDLKDKITETDTSGTGILLGAGAEMVVNSDLGELKVSHLKSGSSASTETITFNAGGELIAKSASIDAGDTPTALDIGSGELVLTEGLTFFTDKRVDDSSTQDVVEQNPADVSLKSGIIRVGNTLDTVGSKLVLGDGANTGGTLALGFADLETDKYGYLTDAGKQGVLSNTSSATDNLVNGDLELNGKDGTDNKSALLVDYGNWTLQNITATKNGFITVGMSALDGIQAADIQYGSGAPSLKAKKVDLKGTSTLTVNEQASASFEQLLVDGTSNITINNSSLTVEGKKTVNEKATDKAKNVFYGFSTTANGTIKVSGSKGVLTIGATALEAIDKIQAKTTGNTKEFEVTYDADLENATPFAKNISLSQMATLKLDFGKDTKFSVDQVNALRATFLADAATYGESIKTGFIDLGQATIEGIEVDKETGTISYKSLKSFNDVNANFGDVVNADLKGAQVVDIGQTDTLSANVGNVKLNGYDSTLNVGKTNLFTADKNGLFVSNVESPNKAGNASVTSGGSLGLYNGGTIGTVTLKAGGSLSETTLLVSSEKGETKIGQIKGATGTSVTIDGVTVVEKGIDSVSELVVNEELKVVSGGITADVLSSSEGAKGGKITSDTLNVASDKDAVFTKYNGDFDISGVAEFQTYAELGGQNMKFGTLKFGRTEGDTLKLTGGNTSAGVLEFAGGNNEVYVGTPAKLDDKGNIVESGSSATLFAARADIDGNDIYADPTFGLPSSMVMFKQVGKTTDLTEAKIKANGNQAGLLNGSLNALRNSVIAVGIDGKDSAEAQAAVRADLANLFDANGSLVDPSVKGNEDAISSVVYVAKALDLSKDSTILAYNDTYSNVQNKFDNDVDGFQTTVNSNDIILGANTALAISDVATAAVKTTTTGTGKDEVTTTSGRAAIHFDKTGASMYAEKDAKILLTGDGLKAGSTVNLFSDKDAAGSEGIKLTLADGVESITVQSINGLLKYDMKAGENVGQGVTLALDMDVVNNSYNDASEPVKHAIVSYLAGDMNWDDTSANAKKVQLLGDNVSGAVKYEGGKFVWTDATVTDKLNQADFVAVETKDAEGKVTYEVYNQAYNALLDNANKTTSGRDVESVARMGVFGGAAQAALTATGTTADAVSGRFGMGQQAGTMTVSSNGQGSGMWVTPVYRSADVDGFGADNVSYGSDVKLFGAAIGGDFTMANGVRVGGMLNIGSGDADGQGIGSAVSNDFNYFGGALYAGFALDNLSIVGDLGYSVIDSDVTANTAIGQASTSFDTTVMTAGVTGQYSMNFGGVDVVPHAGLRFTRIDMDNYDVVTPEADLAHYNASTSNVFSIPVGVTIAKEYVMDTWTVKPSFDLTLTGNFGDDTLDGNVEWAGISNMTTEVKSEFVDSFTYGSAIGIAAKSGNLGLGVGLNYTGSSNVKEFGASANVRYVF